MPELSSAVVAWQLLIWGVIFAAERFLGLAGVYIATAFLVVFTLKHTKTFSLLLVQASNLAMAYFVITGIAGEEFSKLVESARSVLPTAGVWEIIIIGLLAIAGIVAIGYKRMALFMYGSAGKLGQRLDKSNPVKSAIGLIIKRVAPGEFLPSIPGLDVVEGELSYRLYLHVPHAEKESAKAMGARWDKDNRAWYVPAGINIEGFLQRWAVNSEATKLPTSKYNISSQI